MSNPDPLNRRGILDTRNCSQENNNLAVAIAIEKVWLHDFVIVNNGECRRIRRSDLPIDRKKVYCSLETKEAGEQVQLCNDEAIFDVVG